MTDLPSFSNPPVIETALSVQFPPLRGFTNGHLGLFWEGLRDSFPVANDAQPIEPQYEQFPASSLPRSLPNIRISTGQSASRLRMTSTDGHEMVQIQNGRIIFNWRALQDGEYPRWSSVEPSFQKAYDHLTNFAGREKLGDIKPNQWEVTYVNHLVRGREWRDLAECHSVVPGVIGRLSVTSMDTLDSIGADLHFGLPKQAGRLHVELNHGFASADEDASELLVLKLTARGSVSEENDHKAGLRLGRETIVRAFTDLTSDDAHAKWGRLS